MFKIKQFYRYLIIGLTSNFIIYLTYFFITHIGMGPKLAMTLLYGVGVIQTFAFNIKWSFSYEGSTVPAFVRYVAIYSIGYVINFFALMLLVDQAKLPHQLVQGAMLFIIAIIIFIAQRCWVFPHQKSDNL
jgi:putative flippase GtrA